MKKRKRIIYISIVLLLVFLGCDKAPQESDQAISDQKPITGKDYIFVPVSNSLHVIDCETDTVVKTIDYDDYIFHGRVSPDRKRYYLNSFHSIYAVDTKKMELVDTFNFSTPLSKVTVMGFNVSNDNKKLYLSCSIVKKKQNIPKLNLLPQQFIVFDIQKKTIIRNYDIPYNINLIMPIANDPNRVILGGRDLFTLNLKTGKMETLMNMFTNKEGEYPRSFLSMGELNAPGDHNIGIIGYATGEYLVTGKGFDLKLGYLFVDKNNGTLRTLIGKDLWMAFNNALSPDQKYIFSVMDELIKIDAETGETVKFVQTETGTNYSLAFSSDGEKVYIGPGGADVSVYDTETLDLLKVIPIDADGAVLTRISL